MQATFHILNSKFICYYILRNYNSLSYVRVVVLLSMSFSFIGQAELAAADVLRGESSAHFAPLIAIPSSMVDTISSRRRVVEAMP